jgi:6-phosphogluconolactonase (cycloisomerase 2 family)
VFVQTDNPAGNTIVAYDRASDGMLTQAGSYPTGGLGGVESGSVVDHLASEGSLVYDQGGNLLYSVNAGSNTVTVFAVAGDHLIRTQVVPSGGTFPVSIAVHGSQVYVLNAFGGGSIQGYERIGTQLVAIPGWNRQLNLGTTSASAFTATPGQVAFSPNGSQLLVTTKGTTNSIDVFSVNPFTGPSTSPTVNTEAGAVPFGEAFDRGGNLAVAEAGPSAIATFRLAPNGQLTPIAQVLTGQAATCWVIDDGTTLYTSNAGSGTESGFADVGNGALQPLGNTTTDGGTVDTTATPNGQFVYAQAGASGNVDEYRTGPGGSLTEIGSLIVPGAVGGEGIVAL